jgi:HlyD family secretion protein
MFEARPVTLKSAISRYFTRFGPWLLLLLLMVSVFWYFRPDTEPTGGFRFAAVKRTDVVASISATGTLEPEEVVDVGAQVAGRIVQFGQSPAGGMVDYGTPVEEGTVLARIDESLYAADAAQQRAQLQRARAGLARAEADLQVAQAKRVQAERAWRRADNLLTRKLIAPGDHDTARANFDVADATVALNRSAVEEAHAGVTQAEAGLQRAERNLAYCVIKSPVKGVIIDRRVNIGQTVVASLSAPSLFLIAKDLKRMQVWVAVNEADIGRIRPGMPARFTVDAFPDRTFQGQVQKVRLNAAMTQNVVTYTVEVQTDNRDGLLLPYLTANVRFVLEERPQVLTVPNAALRWRPAPERMHPAIRGQYEETSDAGDAVAKKEGQTQTAEAPSTGVVWISDERWVRPVRLALGINDGNATEVTRGELREGDKVIVGDASGSASDNGYTSPFTPKFSGRGGRR